jgi:hypothetical protein
MNLSKKSAEHMWVKWIEAGALGHEITDREVLDWSSESNRRVLQIWKIEELISSVFKEADTPDGRTREEVEAMTFYQQIEFLERLAGSDDFARSMPDLSQKVSYFVEEVDKRDFRTAKDF